MRVYGTGHDTTIDQPPTTPKENRSRNSRSHDQITRGGALIPHHHHAQPTNHTLTNREKEKERTEGGGNQQHLPPRQAIRRRTERASAQQPNHGRQTRQRAIAQPTQCYIRSNLYNTWGRKTCGGKERRDGRPSSRFFLGGFFFWNGSGILQRERDQRGLAAGCLIYMPFISYHFFSDLVWHERKKRRRGKYLWPHGHLGWMDGTGRGWRWLLWMSSLFFYFFLELYIPALACLLARDMGDLRQGHRTVDGGPGTGTQGPKVGTGGPYICAN